ncbi:MAG: hypothetical protein JKY45_10950 [Emcibacter sp.]|nr:hypothetical protein [Emcibacter sp.]
MLENFVFKSSILLQPVLEQAKKSSKNIIFAEGENESVLLAVQALVDEKMGHPILVGRPVVVSQKIEKLGLRLEIDRDFDLINPQKDDRYRHYWQKYHELVSRKGVSAEAARTIVRTNTTVIAALAVHMGDADAMICGTYGRFDFHVKYIIDIIGRKSEKHNLSTVSTLILPRRTIFFADSFMTVDPDVDQIVENTLAAAEKVGHFGVEPKVALLSHSNFGSSNAPSARKMRKAAKILRDMKPDMQIDGEMHADAALREETRDRMVSDSRLTGSANLFIFPNLDAANICIEMLRSVDDGLLVGPILLGAARPVHIVTPSATAKGIFNMAAIALADAEKQGKSEKV